MAYDEDGEKHSEDREGDRWGETVSGWGETVSGWGEDRLEGANSNDKEVQDVKSRIAELCMRLVEHMCVDGLRARLARKATSWRMMRTVR